MHSLMHDLAFAWRSALKRPSTSLLVVLTLALGIGVNSAMFSITYQVLLAPLPYEDGDRLVKLEQQAPRLGRFVPAGLQGGRCESHGGPANRMTALCRKRSINFYQNRRTS